jgi:hypothetical protein
VRSDTVFLSANDDSDNDQEPVIVRLLEFLARPADWNPRYLVVHENRLVPARVGNFDKSLAFSFLRIYIRDFLLDEGNTSINSSFDGESGALHLDINSRRPRENTLTTMLSNFVLFDVQKGGM